MTQFITRAYNNIQVNPTSRATLLKSSQELRLLDEIAYYQKVPADLSVYYPRLVSIRQDGDIHTMELEYYAYDNLGNLMIKGDSNPGIWDNVFDYLFTYLDNCKKHSMQRPDVIDSHMMYVKKTESEYQNLVNGFPFFGKLDQHDHLVLNGRELKSFRTIWPRIKEYITDHCYTKDFNVIHGDLCFSNILYGVNPNNNDVVLKFIDPRGSFGSVKVYGDPYYDLAKLKHSCQSGYEYLITDNFTIKEVESSSFELNYSNNNGQEINRKLSNYIDRYGYNQTKVDIVHGTIYIGMCARHYDSIERQKAMLLIGLEMLNNVYEQI